MKRLLVFLLLSVLVVACGHKDNGIMPDRLLTQAEMIDIMTDVQIIEAEINYQKTQVQESESEPVDYMALSRSCYEQLFEHYGITDSIFVQNMRYYNKYPSQLEKIMDSVTQRLLRVQAELNNN